MTFWQDKKVVVTGGCGFVGSHLVPLLVEQGAQVLVVDDMRRGRNLPPKGVTVLRLDAGDPRALAKPFTGAHAVFNLAAHVAGVIYNQHNHLEMYRENERLQVAPVLAAEQAGVERFLQVSSVCVYAPEYNHPAIEGFGHMDEPVRANNGYSWAKRMGEKAAWWSKIPHVVTVRPSNLYGPRDYFDERAHVIPALIKKALHDDVITVNGTGHEQREFLYVEDAARGMLAALEDGIRQGAYNLGTDGATCVSIRDLMDMIQVVCGTDKPVTYASDHDPGDPARWSSAKNIATDTGWRHRVHLLEGLKNTVEWYRSL